MERDTLAIGLRRKLDHLHERAPVIRLGDGGKLVVFSDLHLGDGGADDDFAANAELLAAALERYYEKENYILALNGDIEELMRFPLARIQGRWQGIYAVWQRFAGRGAFFKTVGNHDQGLLRHEPGELSLPVSESLRVEMGGHRLWLFHGHQVSRVNWLFQTLGRLALRWLLHPLGIGNYTVARSSRRRFRVEKRAYLFARQKKIMVLIGHTHRPLFESLSRLDTVKIEIENLCRSYPAAGPVMKRELEQRLARLKREYIELQHRDPQPRRVENLYHEGPLLPCLFNSGCGIGRHGITALEFVEGRAALVYWVDRQRSGKYVASEGYDPQPLDGSQYSRVVLKEEDLDYIFTRIRLLG
ncbi:MAG: metallophosphoesterase family protein [Acidobacteria bacterium]|jgi:UDP-2,3-diacylglucosamine pyrophosphatase LpxH|nr:metallophosphoesterase family protein [Acidobacteriota bacterium]